MFIAMHMKMCTNLVIIIIIMIIFLLLLYCYYQRCISTNLKVTEPLSVLHCSKSYTRLLVLYVQSVEILYYYIILLLHMIAVTLQMTAEFIST